MDEKRKNETEKAGWRTGGERAEREEETKRLLVRGGGGDFFRGSGIPFFYFFSYKS